MQNLRPRRLCGAPPAFQHEQASEIDAARVRREDIAQVRQIESLYQSLAASDVAVAEQLQATRNSSGEMPHASALEQQMLGWEAVGLQPLALQALGPQPLEQPALRQPAFPVLALPPLPYPDASTAACATQPNATQPRLGGNGSGQDEDSGFEYLRPRHTEPPPTSHAFLYRDAIGAAAAAGTPNDTSTSPLMRAAHGPVVVTAQATYPPAPSGLRRVTTRRSPGPAGEPPINGSIIRMIGAGAVEVYDFAEDAIDRLLAIDGLHSVALHNVASSIVFLSTIPSLRCVTINIAPGAVVDRLIPDLSACLSLTSLRVYGVALIGSHIAFCVQLMRNLNSLTITHADNNMEFLLSASMRASLHKLKIYLPGEVASIDWMNRFVLALHGLQHITPSSIGVACCP
jgi:hypothetical protein